MAGSNLSRLISPRSIVVVGNKGANFAIKESLKMGYDGEIWCVHPNRQSIEGIDCIKSIKELPYPPDAAFIAVNAESTIDVVRDLSDMGCGGAVVYASGFGEVGDDGHTRNNRLTDAAANMPIIGPNCYGLINNLDKVALWPDTHGCDVVDSGVAIITQSGNIGLNMTMQDIGLDIALMFTIGNQAITSISDIMNAVLDDDRVCAIGLHIEGIQDIEDFDAVATRALKKKIPVVTLKSGRTDSSAKIALSHTSSLTGSDQLFDVLFKRLGIARVDTVPEFLETLKLLSTLGPMQNNKLASMSCSGGEAGMMADLIDGLDVVFPSLDREHKDSIKATLNDYVKVDNPLDYHTFVWGDRDRTAACFEAMMSADFSATMLLLDWPKGDKSKHHEWDLTFKALCDASIATGNKAIVLASISDCMPKRIISECKSKGIIPMIGLDTCLKSLHHAYRFSKAIDDISLATIEPIKVIRYDNKSEKIINEFDGKNLLAGYGLGVPNGELVNSIEDALAVAEKINYPVTVKVSGASLVHKTEMGGVRLNINNAEMLTSAVNDLLSIEPNLLVESMLDGAVAELIIGASFDPLFGSYLVIGSGGVLVELTNDSAALLFPINRQDILSALSQLQISPILGGYRGKPSGDIDAIVDAVMAVAKFVKDNQVIELDVNPLLVFPQGKGATAVDVLIKLNDEKT